MTKNIIIALFLGIFISCKTPNTNNPVAFQQHLDSITYVQNAIFCDTCVSTLIVEHQECTECSDLFVDSGIVFIGKNVIAQFDFEQKRKTKSRINTLKLNTLDLCFEDKHDYYKLWPDTISFKDWGKKYRVTGKVTEYNESYLTFKLLNYTLLDTIYARKFDN